MFTLKWGRLWWSRKLIFLLLVTGTKVKPKRLTEVVRDIFSLSFDFALFFFLFLPFEETFRVGCTSLLPLCRIIKLYFVLVVFVISPPFLMIRFTLIIIDGWTRVCLMSLTRPDSLVCWTVWVHSSLLLFASRLFSRIVLFVCCSENTLVELYVAFRYLLIDHERRLRIILSLFLFLSRWVEVLKVAANVVLASFWYSIG